MNKNQHVVKHERGWAVRGENNTKVTKVFDTQEQAIQKGKRIATNQKAELLIHGRNGKIREKNTYGKDNFPPRG